MSEKTCLKSMTAEEMQQFMAGIGQPAYRAKQIFKWLHLGVTSFEQMTDLPKSLREKLSEHTVISDLEMVSKRVSKQDGTIKYLFGLSDQNSIETVLMQYEHGNSLCISTQAGCRMGCAFCASFDPHKARNLTAAEMLDQVLCAQRDSGRKVGSIVLMGTGEPLDNFDNVMLFLSLVSAPGGLNIGMRNISLSTCGLLPEIEKLSKLKLQLTLSVSLHAPNDDIRAKLMPIAKKYPLNSLMKACKRYFEHTGRRISFEYAMIDQLNDTEQCAKELSALLKGFNCHVNLIPLNAIEGGAFKGSSPQTIRAFQDKLLKNKINTTVRRSLGGDIEAACGQLRRISQKDER